MGPIGISGIKRFFFCFFFFGLFGSPSVNGQGGGGHPNATDRTNVGAQQFYSNLWTRSFGPNTRRSLALGIYDQDVTPEALLDVNSTPSHLTQPLGPIGTRGELLRTTAPGNVFANWRFFHGGDQIGRFWSTDFDDHLRITAPSGQLHLQSDANDIHIDQDNGATVGRFTSPGGANPAFNLRATVGQMRLHSNNDADQEVRIWGESEDGGVSINGQDPNEPIIPRIALLNVGEYDGTGDRNWMKHGAFMGLDSDGMYLGMKPENPGFFGAGEVDAVINWNDNIGTGGFLQNPVRDNLRFIFTVRDDVNGTTASGTDGLEVARMDPGATGNGANVTGAAPENTGLGIGNFHAGGTDIPVTARLDVLRGDVRFRTLPNITNNNLNQVVVVQPNGVLRVRDAATIGGGDSDWFVSNTSNTPTSINDPVYSQQRVGVGDFFASNVAFDGGKFEVVNQTNGTDFPHGARVHSNATSASDTLEFVTGVNSTLRGTGDAKFGYAVRGMATSSGFPKNSRGVYGEARGKGNNMGVQGKAVSSSSSSTPGNFAGGLHYGGYFKAANGVNENFGVRAIASGNSGVNYGVYATAQNASTGNPGNPSNGAAGYFVGDVFTTTTYNSSSDQMFKQNLDSLDSALTKLNQLNPLSFEYDTSNYGFMGFPGGEHFGMVAQEVEQVIPELVREVHHPAVTDSAGNVIQPAFDFKTVPYQRFIPFLVQGIQDQQEQLDSLDQRLDSLEQRNDSLLTLIQENQARDEQQSDSLLTLYSKLDSLNTDSLLARINALENCVANLPPGLGCGDSSNAKRENDGGASRATSITIETKVHVQYDSSMAESKTELHQNQPNPFRYVTTFTYDLAEEGRVELVIHDQQGRYVTHVVDAQQGPGHHKVRWNATDAKPGIYYYTLRVDGTEWVRKAIKLK